MQIDTAAPLKLHAFTDPKSILWEKIAETTGLHLQEPNLSADLEGTWAAPRGQVALQIRRVDLTGLERQIPSVDNLDLLAVMDRATARISRFNFNVEKQPVNITGEIPLGESFWAGLRHKQHLPDWRQASARLVIVNAQVAPFASLLPEILSPEGTANADISRFSRAGTFHGRIAPSPTRGHIRSKALGPSATSSCSRGSMAGNCDLKIPPAKSAASA